jgi:hypothetical protein
LKQILCNKSATLVVTKNNRVITSVTNTSHQGHPPLSDKHFIKWLKSHRSVFSWACFNAFQLKDHPERAISHIFFVAIESHAQPQTGRKKKHGTENRFHITQAILSTRDAFLQAHPETDVFLSKLDESAAAVDSGGPSNVVSTDMVVRCGNDWDFLRLTWEQDELDEMQQDEQWASILLSMTNEEALYQMVDGRPVKL